MTASFIVYDSKCITGAGLCVKFFPLEVEEGVEEEERWGKRVGE